MYHYVEGGGGTSAGGCGGGGGDGVFAFLADADVWGPRWCKLSLFDPCALKGVRFQNS